MTALILAGLAVIIVTRHRRGRPLPGGAAGQTAATVAAEAVAVTREPSAQGPSIASLSRGERLTVLGNRGRWVEVRTDKGVTGFVSAEAVETGQEKEARERRAGRMLSFSPVFGVVAEDTDILLAPFPLAPRGGRLRKGSAVTIHAVDHAYYAFRAADGTVAFVNSAAVDLVPPDPRRPAIVAGGDRVVKDVKLKDLARPEPPAEEEPEGIASEAGPPLLEDFVAPVLLSKVDPRYPEVARRAGVEGTVILDATISETGRVTDVEVLRGLPLGLSEAAVEAVQRWHYRPARRRFGPIVAHKTIRIVFALGD